MVALVGFRPRQVAHDFHVVGVGVEQGAQFGNAVGLARAHAAKEIGESPVRTGREGVFFGNNGHWM